MSPGEPGVVPVCTPGQEWNHKYINDCGFFNITFFFFFCHMTYDNWIIMCFGVDFFEFIQSV